MRRRNGLTQNTRTPEQTATQQHDRDKRSRQHKRHVRWSTSDAVSAAVGHPLFGFVLFLIIFPGWTLLSTAQRRCTEGHLPGCRHNNPAPVLARSSQQQLHLPNWRLDGRCGPSFPSSADQQSSICDPFSATPCCSQWGWCGSGPNYCVQAVKAPYNHSGSALQQFWVDLQQKIASKPDIFQSAYHDAHQPITRNHSKLVTALHDAEPLTAAQQDLIRSGVVTKRKNLECFTCCTNQPPFRISAHGYWTQDTRLPSNASSFMQQLGFSQQDESSNTPSIWQRVFGTRTLLTTLSTAANQRGFSTYRRYFRGHLGSPPQPPRSPPSQTAAQRDDRSSNETARPLLRRQNAFRLNERQSDRLTQQLGLTQQAHGASRHELLAAADAIQDVNPSSYAKYSGASAGQIDLQAVAADKTAVESRAGSVSSKLGLPQISQQDSHHSFNATTAYANVSRCNPQRWVHLHAQGRCCAPAITGRMVKRLDHVCQVALWVLDSTPTPRTPYQVSKYWSDTAGTDFKRGRHDSSGRLVKPAPNLVFNPVQTQPARRVPAALFGGSLADAEGSPQALVIYHYHESLTTCEEDEEVQVIRTNMLTFLRFAVRENDGVHYVFSMGGRIDANLLDLIPGFSNVRVRFVDNSTMHSDTCSFQRALAEFGPRLLETYKYYAVINNGMRGPFAAAGQGFEQQHWLQPFIDKIDSHVKVVGPYLSCEIAIHLQGPFLVLDRVGVRYMLDVWSGCWRDHQADIENGEIGLSQALLADGYNIASLQHEYAGLDFRRQPDKLKCKGLVGNPTFCCESPDALKLHWVKYGGAVYRIGLLPPPLIRAVEDLTEQTMKLSSPLNPDGSHWSLPHSDWVHQQNAAKQHSDRSTWLQAITDALARLMSPGESQPEPETLTKRVAALLQSVPSQVQQAAGQFGGQRAEPSLVSWIADAAIKLKSDAIAIKSAT